MTERPWWRDPRRLDPWTERARAKTLTPARVWGLRATWLAMVVFGIVMSLEVGSAFVLVPYLFFITVMVAMLPKHQRQQLFRLRRPT